MVVIKIAPKLRYFPIFLGVRLAPEQFKIVNQLYKKYPNLYSSKSHVIRAALNFFIKHNKAGWEL